ncbi:MAG: F0F1 ATP synthase subunit gamma [Blautia sp.]
MANAKEIQSRINSIQDTMKITNAMYMISSSKLKKEQERTWRIRSRIFMRSRDC